MKYYNFLLTVEGNYTFSSQENFEEFIGAVVGTLTLDYK
jgi:hypothetical protein